MFPFCLRVELLLQGDAAVRPDDWVGVAHLADVSGLFSHSLEVGFVLALLLLMRLRQPPQLDIMGPLTTSDELEFLKQLLLLGFKILHFE